MVIKIYAARLLSRSNSRRSSSSSRNLRRYSVTRYPNRTFDRVFKATWIPMASTDAPSVDSPSAAHPPLLTPVPSHSAYRPRFVDIGINLTDSSFVGVYHRKKVILMLLQLDLHLRIVVSYFFGQKLLFSPVEGVEGTL